MEIIMQFITEQNIQKKRNYNLLTYEQKEKIYKVDRHKFSKKAIASYYNIHEKSVHNIIESFKKQQKVQKLTDQDAIAIIESKANPDVVNKIVEAKAELMTAEAEAQRAEANIKNTVHSTIENSLSNNQNKADSRTTQLNQLLQKQEKKLESQNIVLEKLQSKLVEAIEQDIDITALSEAISATAAIIDKTSQTIERITNTILKMNKSDSDLLNDHFKTLEHYGLSKKSASSVNIQNNLQQNLQNGEYDSSGNYIPTEKESESVAISFKITTNQEEYSNEVAKQKADVVDAEYTIENT